MKRFILISSYENETLRNTPIFDKLLTQGNN